MNSNKDTNKDAILTPDSFHSIRDILVNKLIRLLFFVLFPLLIFSLLRILQVGWLPVMALHITIFIVLCLFYFFTKKISSHVKAICIISIFILVGSGAVIHNENTVYANGFYIIACILTLIFFELKTTFILLLLISSFQVTYVINSPVHNLLHPYLQIFGNVILMFVAFYLIQSMKNYLLLLVNKLQIQNEKLDSAKERVNSFNTKLKSMVASKTEELTDLLSIYDKTVLSSKTDTNGNFTYASQAFCKISGYTQDELIGKSHRIMRHPEMSKEVLKDLSETVKSNKIWKGEIKNLKKNSDFFWAEVIVSPEYNKDGKINGYSTIRQDITAKKSLEELSGNLECKINERTKELQEATSVISKSLDFASIIQKTFDFRDEEMKHFFDDYFVFLEQKDVVGGDIIIFDELNEDECLIMVIDCTGHGVPGAFVTMIVKTLARQISESIRSGQIPVSTSAILQIFNYEIKFLLNQWKQTSKSNVGFDGQILYYNKRNNLVTFSSARNDLIVFDNNKFSRIRGDRHSVGYRDSKLDFSFEEHKITIESDTIFYIYSDGFTDQLGGTKEIPFGYKKTLQLLEGCKNLKMSEQKAYLVNGINDYKKEHEQNDDIAFVGLKIIKKVE